MAELTPRRARLGCHGSGDGRLLCWRDILTPQAGEGKIVHDLPSQRCKGLPEDLPLPPYIPWDTGTSKPSRPATWQVDWWPGSMATRGQEEAAGTVPKADPRCGAVHPQLCWCVERENK